VTKNVGKKLRVLIVNDMEGISGINDWHQIFYGYKEFEDFGKVQVTEDVNAAIRGLRAANATEIRVADAHGPGGPKNNNIILERLEKDVRLFQDQPIAVRVKEASDRSVAAAVLIGFHAMADTKDGFLRHTRTLEPRIKINGKSVGETALCAYELGEKDIPVIMVTGDQALIREAKSLLPGIETVQVKTSLDSKTTKCLPVRRARKLIQRGAQQALSRIDEFDRLKVKKPIKVDVSFPEKKEADQSEIIPKAKRTAKNTVSYIARDWDEADRFIMTAMRLAEPVARRGLMQKLSALKGFEKAEREFLEDLVEKWLS
jgi:D-amino peptidase